MAKIGSQEIQNISGEAGHPLLSRRVSVETLRKPALQEDTQIKPKLK